MQKIDAKFLEKMNAFLHRQCPKSRLTLPEQVERESLDQKLFRDLPVPLSMKWSTETGLVPVESSCGTLAPPLKVTLTDLERFESLPLDLRREERSTLHFFLLHSHYHTNQDCFLEGPDCGVQRQAIRATSSQTRRAGVCLTDL